MFLLVFLLSLAIGFAITILQVVATWKIYDKAGYSGWKSIVPVYNTYILSKIATGSSTLFWVLLSLIIGMGIFLVFDGLVVVSYILSLIANIINVVILYNLFKSFGLTTFGAIMATLCPAIGLPITAFGNYQYQG